MFGFFKRKKEIKKLTEDVHDSFDHVKKDFNKVGQWITHLDDKSRENQKDILNIRDTVFHIQNDLDEIKDFISF